MDNRGFVLLEVLITIFVVVFGLLGLVGLQNRMLEAEMDSYQRSQAIAIVNDMAQRIKGNPKGAPCYGFSDSGAASNYVGTGATATVCSKANLTGAGLASDVADKVKALVDRDIDAWHNNLLGVSEKAGVSNTNVGSIIDARGCVLSLNPQKTEFLVTVTWKGLVATKSPPVNCAKDLYVDDATRRVLSVVVRAPDYDCDTAAGTGC